MSRGERGEDGSNVFLTRNLRYDPGDGGPVADVFVDIHRPRPVEHANGVDYVCHASITGLPPGNDDPFDIWGVDEVQSLLLCLNILAVYLDRLREQLPGQLTWLGEPDLGFPVIRGA